MCVSLNWSFLNVLGFLDLYAYLFPNLGNFCAIISSNKLLCLPSLSVTLYLSTGALTCSIIPVIYLYTFWFCFSSFSSTPVEWFPLSFLLSLLMFHFSFFSIVDVLATLGLSCFIKGIFSLLLHCAESLVEACRLLTVHVGSSSPARDEKPRSPALEYGVLATFHFSKLFPLRPPGKSLIFVLLHLFCSWIPRLKLSA